MPARSRRRSARDAGNAYVDSPTTRSPASGSRRRSPFAGGASVESSYATCRAEREAERGPHHARVKRVKRWSFRSARMLFAGQPETPATARKRGSYKPRWWAIACRAARGCGRSELARVRANSDRPRTSSIEEVDGNRDTRSPRRLVLQRYAAGNVTRTVVPRPSMLSIPSDPPWAWTMCLTIARPRPVPPSSRERARSTR
jgi:hypothetical protein